MLLESIRRMCDLFFEGQWRWTHRFLLVIWLLLLAAAPPNAFGFFMGDTKAVLNGCEDHWTLQDRAAMPLLFQMTVCVNIRVVVPGAWVAFSYSSVHAPGPELGLEGDDEALYGWLLRVRHRFPLRLSPTDWHRVCLRRDVQRNTFSLEVDGEMVAERTVIARAIPPSGSLWLGCRPRDRPLGAKLGQVELYLFRMWEDLSDHGLCEDGTVIGWNNQYWGLTSSNARQRDPSLLCATKTGVGRLFTTPPVPSATSSPVIVTPVTHISNQTTQVAGSSLVNCDISQLCSNTNAYFWMSISVEAEGGSKTEQDVHSLVSKAFGCHDEAARRVTGFIDFCQDDRQLQVKVVQVSCKAKRDIRETTCDVLLQLSHAVSACELQRAGVSALQQAGGQQIQARITGEVERVGRDLCEDVEPSSGGFVRCTSTSSLEDICQANKQSKLTCSLIEPHSNPAPQPMAGSCSREASRFYDCTAFCNSTSQFFATRINISSASVNVDLLKGLLSGVSVAHMCDAMSGSTCQDSEILKLYQGAHLECHGTQQRLYSCMVILEMSGPVDSCSLNEVVQQLMDSSPGITSERPLTRMAVCGPPGLPVRTLLTSNLTWVASDLLTSDLCQADPYLLKWQIEAKEILAVLLTDSCTPTTQPSTVTSSSITTAPGASMSSVTNTAAQTYTTAETTAAHKHLNASQGTTTLTAISSAQSSTAPPVLHTSSQHVTLSGSTTAQSTASSDNTTSLTPTGSTELPSTAQQNTAGFTTSSASSAIHISSTLSPNHTTRYNVTTADTFTPSPNDTTLYSVTTADDRDLHNSTFTTSNATVSTFTLSPEHTTMYNVTTADTFTPSPSHMTEYNVTTAGSYTQQHNSTVTTTNTTVSTFTPTPNHTAEINTTTATTDYTTEYNVTTADSRSLHNGTTLTSNATMSTFTPSPNYTVMNNLTTVSNSSTTAESMITTTVPPTTATDNMTTSPIRETQQSTTAPSKSTTKSARQTLNATTSTTNSAVTTNTNTTTAAAGVSPIINHNQTTGINPSSTASSSTAAVDPTTEGPGVSLTAAATSPTRGPLPVQVSTTAAEVSPTSSTTSTFAGTTTTKPGSGTTPTTTAETTKSQEAQEELANELLDQTQDASQLNSSQVEQVAQQLEKLLDGPTVSQAVGQKAVSIISNLMEGDPQALSASANRLIQAVDDLGLKLVVAGDREVISSNSLVLAVRTVDGTNFPATSVDIFNTDNVQLRALSRSRFKRSGSALGSVFLPSSITAGLSPEQQQQASRVQFTFYTKSALFQDATLDNQTLVSPVLASSVANLSISNLSENIQFTIRNTNSMNASNTSCAFWDFTLNGGGGGWSSAGCLLVNTTPEETTCSCNHLTSFAILLDLSREGLADRQQAQILTFITYIGCGISAIFLAVTLLTYLSFEKLLRDIPAKILVQLCMSLLLLNLVFLLDGWLALYPAIGLCISTAFFLHYFLLTSFTWAGLEALHMYLSVVQVFTPYLSRYMLKFSLMGWGIPLIVVIVVISVDKDNYGLVTYGKYTDGSSDDFCWLRNDIAFYVGVVAYFLLIFALCLLVFIMVMVQLARIKKQNPQNQSPNRGVLTDLRSIAGLIILLGLTWGFALFAWGPLYLPFVYLFSIFNTLQGFLVFVFHCAVKENVRRQWRTYLCCGRLRLAENSEWSRTATHNNRNTSVATATTSARHFTTSRSSSVISDGTNSSGSVFADSGISDGSSSDVVLNEIHRRNLML